LRPREAPLLEEQRYVRDREQANLCFWLAESGFLGSFFAAWQEV
jgi:hypothetical protein